jgi:DNA polymerase type B, organellar and viral
MGSTLSGSDFTAGCELPGLAQEDGEGLDACRLPIALRAYTERVRESEPGSGRSRPVLLGWSDIALVLDTETTTDAAQRLLFGSYRLIDLRSGKCVGEGIFYENDLFSTNAVGFACLEAYSRTRRAEVVGPNQEIRFLSAREFLDEVLWRTAQIGGLIVGFNLPFDLSRLANGWGEANRRFRGGFSLHLWKYRHKRTGKMRVSWYRPRIRIKHLDSKRSFIRFTQPRLERDNRFGRALLESRFIDLRMLGFALTNVGHSLESACKAFGVEHGKTRADRHGEITEEYIDYNRRDVLATVELFLKMREEFSRHPISLDPCKAYSPASISKAYLREMGLIPPTKKFANISKTVLGYTMTAYYGGRSECRIRLKIVPVIYLDFLSMYPTVNSLMGLWRVLTAESLQIVDATDEVQALLESVSKEKCFEPGFWPNLLFFALIEPHGDILPDRAEYGDGSSSLNIGVNPLYCSTPLWFAGPDLVASTLLTGKPPKVLRAFKLVPKGTRQGLTPIKLRGVVAIDPRQEDFFRVMVEQRAEIKASKTPPREERDRLERSLKVNANSGSYGIFAEMNREELAAKERATIEVYGLNEPFHCTTPAPEDPGAFFFAPIAALIPAAARLMLALLERCVEDAGGSYAFCDTDSLAVVATEDGGWLDDFGVRALSWSEVDAIVALFRALNPYNRKAVPGSILKLEKENFRDGERVQLHAFCISAKRYALFNLNPDGTISLRKTSEHGLGHLLNPLDPEAQAVKGDEEDAPQWIQSLWEVLIRRQLGQCPDLPEWINRPALSRVGATTPEIVRRLNQARRHLPYAEQVKPSNFVLAAHVKPMGHPVGQDPEKFQLIAAYDRDPRKWLRLRWINRYTGKVHPITTHDLGDSNVARVKSYADVLEEYATHPEPKSADATGKPCGRGTTGLLYRQPVHAGSIYYVGKESNFLEDVEYGLLHDLDDVQQKYFDPNEDVWKALRSALKRFPSREIARRTALSTRYIRGLRNGHKDPSHKTARVLLRGIEGWSTERGVKGRLGRTAK